MSRIGRAMVVLLAAVACLAAPAGAAPAGAAPAVTGAEVAACAVTYRADPYDGGFTARIIVRNAGTATIYGWTFSFRLPDGVEIVELWEAELISPRGDAAARDLGYNGVVRPGDSIGLGFRAVGPAQPSATDFRVNGLRCSVR